MNLGSLGQDNIQKYGKYDCYYFEGKWYTNVDMEEESNRLGNALKSLGVEKGDRVAIQMPNSPVTLWSFPAIYKIGAVAVPMNPSLRPDQSAYIYKNCGAKAVVTSPEYVPWIQAAQKDAADLKHVIVTEKTDIPGTIGYDTLVPKQSNVLPIEKTDNEDLAAMIYTAGTTGPNKGVMHTHFSLYMTGTGYADYRARYVSATLENTLKYTNARTYGVTEVRQIVTGLDRNTMSLFVLPLSHSFGLAVSLMGIINAQRGIIMKRFNPEQALKLIEEFRVINMAAVPTMYIMMLNHPDIDKRDLSSLRECACGSSPLPPDVGRQWKKKVGTDISEGWGMTETGATTAGQIIGIPPRYGSIGKCMIKADTMTIFDDEDHELPAGKIGELVIKGPTIMKGYWGMPEETEATLRNGWLHTGDVGYMDDDGYFYITDRKKDIIIRGGENVSPREVEEVILQVPQILEVGVIGIPDNVYGEEIKAFCVLQKDQSIDGEEIIAFCRQKLPTFKVPKAVQFVDTLPKNLLGKLLRAELRKMEKEQST